NSDPRDATVADVPRDASIVDVSPIHTVDSGCPAPPRVTPTTIPPGFLAPLHARFVRTVDGDTTHFAVPIVGEIDVRYMYVNTEESHPPDITAFGTYTAEAVDRINHT